ncbi:MAG: SpoIIE family protein phosphatase [Luteitalea sp.]|nr:SpoIIE family protein phosphatase [Luteitalea sp.]
MPTLPRLRETSSPTLYLLLFLYILVSLTFWANGVAGFIDGYLNVFDHAREPFFVNFNRSTVDGVRPEAEAAGVATGDVLESLNGEPYRGRSHWIRSVRHLPRGTFVQAGVRKSGGLQKTASIRLAADDVKPSLSEGVLMAFTRILVAYTDGTSEAMNEVEEEWGEERMLQAIEAYRSCSADEILHAVFAPAADFTGNAAQHDDMTLLIMKLD